MVKAMRLLVGLICFIGYHHVFGFCGFYVARADTSLYNDASQVVLVRDGDRSVVTMNNNFRGDVRDFAIVVPIPTFLERGQINVAERALIDHLDQYTAPRLVEYFDKDPCQILRRFDYSREALPSAGQSAAKETRAQSLGVKIEAEYAVGEYDISILSARESQGLLTWLNESGYRVPSDVIPTIGSYLKQGMRFFVAKVNLQTQSTLGYSYLRPLQIAYESPKFMLPIRLGMVNADGAQELYVYALTRSGRVETRNYRAVAIPSGMELPVSIKEDFGTFYQAMFDRQHERHDRRVVFLEYAWDMAWCDPCAADPLSPAELRALGVFWLAPQAKAKTGSDVFVTRLHLRYEQEMFPEDLMFIATGNRANFQGRYVIRHAWSGKPACAAAERYLAVDLPRRRWQEAQTLTDLTGQVSRYDQAAPPQPSTQWWRHLWGNADG